MGCRRGINILGGAGDVPLGWAWQSGNEGVRDSTGNEGAHGITGNEGARGNTGNERDHALTTKTRCAMQCAGVGVRSTDRRSGQAHAIGHCTGVGLPAGPLPAGAETRRLTNSAAQPILTRGSSAQLQGRAPGGATRQQVASLPPEAWWLVRACITRSARCVRCPAAAAGWHATSPATPPPLWPGPAPAGACGGTGTRLLLQPQVPPPLQWERPAAGRGRRNANGTFKTEVWGRHAGQPPQQYACCNLMRATSQGGTRSMECCQPACPCTCNSH